MNTAVTVQREAAALAIVHHANQYVVTDGYDNRVGISGIVGTSSSQTGLLRVLKLHERYRVPFSLHISGTLLESLAWHCPAFLSEISRLAGLGLLELIGGSYAQNMMRFFSPEHNLRQINEELLLYERLLDWDPNRITTFWPTERLWETESMAPVLTSSQLLNGGYRHVVIDDRLLYPTVGSPSPRQLYDYDHSWDPINFQMHVHLEVDRVPRVVVVVELARARAPHGRIEQPIVYHNVPVAPIQELAARQDRGHRFSFPEAFCRPECRDPLRIPI